MNTPKIIVEIKNASIRQEEKEILKGVNLSIAEAEFCYLIGKTGSGKSSFLKTLYGYSPWSSGTGIVAGHALDRIGLKDIPALRRSIGMVFQDFHLFGNWTVRENLVYVLRATDWTDGSKIENRIQEVLKSVRLLDKIGEPVNAMSGGEKQRLAIGRAILNNPVLLVADEPTGNLDPTSADEILYLIRDLTYAHKMATILATHDYRLIEKFPARVYKCADHRLIEV